MDGLDTKLTSAQAARAATLLQAAGFETATEAVCLNTPRSIAWWLGKTSARRRQTVLELLECVLEADDSEAA